MDRTESVDKSQFRESRKLEVSKIKSLRKASKIKKERFLRAYSWCEHTSKKLSRMINATKAVSWNSCRTAVIKKTFEVAVRLAGTRSLSIWFVGLLQVLHLARSGLMRQFWPLNLLTQKISRNLFLKQKLMDRNLWLLTTWRQPKQSATFSTLKQHSYCLQDQTILARCLPTY